jgi:hypothetical protein
MFPTVYRVTQKYFYARRYTSIWAPVVARQISKRYSSSCHVFISIIDLRGLLENDSRTQSTVYSANRHTCRIWGSENPHQVIEYERDTPKLTVWLGLHKHGVIGPFFFMESTVIGHKYLDMLENFAVPQIPPGSIFQQDGAPPHFHRDVNHISGLDFSWTLGRKRRSYCRAP